MPDAKAKEGREAESASVLGRPSSFSDEIADKICARIADGDSLRTICCADEMPSKATVFRWLRENEDFQDQYARAREEQADAIFEDILEIADDARNDWMKANADDDEAYRLNGEHVQRSKLRIDARKWMAGKLRPKVYGDKRLIGSDPENPLPEMGVTLYQIPDNGRDGEGE